MSPKELAHDTIRDLPEDASWQNVEERIRFVAGIEKSRDEVGRGRMVPHEKVRALLDEWISE